MLRRATRADVFGKTGANNAAPASKGSVANFQKRRVDAATTGEGIDIAAKWDPFGSNHYSSESNPWEAFFGQPAAPWKTASYQKYDRSHYNLPEAYEGQSIRLQQDVDELIYLEETFYTSALAPYVFTNEISVTWDKWTFNAHFTGLVPEQGVSRLVTSRREHRQEAFSRRGLALILEHGFMSSPGGREHYFLSLAQIARAVVETINFGVVLAYLTCQNYAKQYEQRHGYFRIRNLRDLLEREKFMWAIAVKEKNGMEKLDAYITEVMDLYGGLADTWLLTPRTATYLRLVPSHKTDYNIAGPAGPARVNDIGFGRNPQEKNTKRLHDSKEPYALFNKYNVYLTRSYNVEATGPVDLMTNVAAVAEFFKIVKPPSAPDMSKGYKSESTHTRIYDEEDNRGYTVTKTMGLNYCQIFDENGEARPLPGGRSIDPIDASDLDRLFCFRRATDAASGGSTYVPIQYLGDINHIYCETGDVADIARATIASYFKKTERKTIAEQLLLGQRRVEEIARLPITASTATPSSASAGAALAAGNIAGWVSWEAVSLLADAGDAALKGLVNAMQLVAARVGPLFGGIRNFFVNPKNASGTIRTAAAVLYENVMIPGASRLFATGAVSDNLLGADSVYADALRLLLTAYYKPLEDAAALAARGANAAALKVERDAIEASLLVPSQAVYEAHLATFMANMDSWARGESREARLAWINGLNQQTTQKARAAAAAGATGRTSTPTPTGLVVLNGQPVPAGFVKASRYNSAEPANQYSAFAGGDSFEIGSHMSMGGGEEDTSFQAGVQLSDMPVMAGLIGAQMRGVSVDDSYLTNVASGSFATQGTSTRGRPSAYLEEDDAPIGRMMTGEDSDYNPRGNNKYNRERAAEQRQRLRDDAVYVPQVGDVLALGEAVNVRFGNMAKNIELFTASQSDAFIRLVGMLYYAAPWRRQTLVDMEANNVPAPVGFLGFRVGTYDMAIGIKLQAGRETAFTAFGNSSFMLSDDAAIKVHYGNYTHYSKTIVREEKNVYVAYNIAPIRALGGMGVAPYKSRDQFNREEKLTLADIFYVMVPYTETEFSQVISMAGRFYTYMDAGMIDAQDPANRELHYSTAAYYNRFWNWYNSENVAPSMEDPLYSNKSSAFRLEAWQGKQGTYNPANGEYNSNIIPNASPWGETGIGSRQMRNGELSEPPVIPPGVLGF